MVNRRPQGVSLVIFLPPELNVQFPCRPEQELTALAITP